MTVKLNSRPGASSSRPSEPRPPASTATPTSPAPAPTWQAEGPRRPLSPAALAIAPGSGKTEIMCPVMRALVNEGRVQMAPNGAVSLDELKGALKELGASNALGAATWGIGTIGNAPKDILHNLTGREMNVLTLPKGIVPHPADSKILRGGRFDEEKFKEFVSHAENGVMTTTSVARAIAASYRRDLAAGDNPLDASVRGLNFAQVEFAGLLAMFGKKNPSTGEVGIRVDDLRTLYEKGTIPPGMLGARSTVIEATALQASLKVKTDAALARSALESVCTPTGLARAGTRLAAGDAPEAGSDASALSSLSAGKAASCPYLTGKAPMPAAPADVVNVHTPAGPTR